ncbi:MAG: D-2-hydroxyacid dehydrogenase [Mariniblastus sp.]
MNSKTIVTCFPLGESHVEQIRTTAKDDFEVIVSTQDQIATDIFKADIFCGHAKVPVDWQAVVDAKKLVWIQSSAAGLDHCLTPPVIDSPIIVSGCSGLFAPQVAEQMMALLMGLVRRLPVFFRAQQIKEYVRRPTDDIFGKTIGIVGFGGNGQRIAHVLKPMVGKILATDCFPESCQALVKNGVVENVYAADELEAMLPQCDVVIVTLPLSDANEKRISDDQFKVFKPGAYLINVGRGSVVDTDSLVRVLASGQLAAAGIDVVDPEPLPSDSPLWEMGNVIISPHVGAQSPLRIPTTIDLFCENLNRFRGKQSLLNQVDKELGFPRPEHRIQFD